MYVHKVKRLFSDFLPLNPSPQIGTVKEHGRAVCNLDVGEFPLMGQFPQEPFADAEITRSIAAANQALGCLRHLNHICIPQALSCLRWGSPLGQGHILPPVR